MTAQRTKEVAETIMAQLGGQRFSVMTGSKSYSSGNFGKGDEYRPGLSFRVGTNPKGVMGVKVTLEPSDTYRMQFLKSGRKPSYEVKVLADVDGVYGDQLQAVFTANTGLYTSL